MAHRVPSAFTNNECARAAATVTTLVAMQTGRRGLFVGFNPS